MVLICQLSSQFVVNDDTGIIENSPQRFIFNSDGKDNEFKERLDLSDAQFNTIKELTSVPQISSEVLFQSRPFAKKLIIKITPEEYWKLSTSQVDQLKIAKLRSALPELTLKEALRCLSTV